MKHLSLVFSAALFLLLAGANVAEAQTTQPPGTRVTACDPLTPNDAICISWTAPTTNVDGSAITLPLTYRVEQALGAGAFSTIRTGSTSTRAYVTKLAPGSYSFRVYTNCTPGCTESAVSNTATQSATAPIVQPNPPIITLAVVIKANAAPVYRILGQGPYTRGEMYGLVPVGRECDPVVVFQYRGLKYRRVTVLPDELWGTTDGRNLAAPCA